MIVGIFGWSRASHFTKILGISGWSGPLTSAELDLVHPKFVNLWIIQFVPCINIKILFFAGICIEALCNPTSVQTLETVNICLKAMHTLLDDPWTRLQLGNDQALAIELLNVLHRFDNKNTFFDPVLSILMKFFRNFILWFNTIYLCQAICT